MMVKQPVKSKLKKLDSKIKKVFSEGHVGVLLEHLEGNMRLIAEGHLDLERKIEDLALETSLIKEDMHNSFSSILNYVSRIEAEIFEIKLDIKKIIEGKTEKKETITIEQRVSKLELELGECKKMIAAAKNS